MPTNPGDQIRVSSLGNLRDLGGWPTRSSGTVKRGLLYRSAGLDFLTPQDMQVLTDLGIRSVFDLRTEAECEARPDQLSPSITYVNLDVFADSSAAAVVHWFDLLNDPALAEEALGGGKAEERISEAYRDMMQLPSADGAYRQLFLAFAEPDRLPGLLHCTTGKDRTGWAAASLLLLLGVSEEDVFREYLLTNDQLLPQLQPIFDQFAEVGGDPELLVPILGVRREYLQMAIDEMTGRYGTIEGYFTEGLGLGPDTQDVLRTTLTIGTNR